MKCIYIFFILFGFDSSAADMFIVDQERDVHIFVVGDEYENIAITPTAFKLNFGMKMEISGMGGKHKLIGNDYIRGWKESTNLTESRIIGRKIPKQMIAFLYNLKKSGIYSFEIQVCLNVKHCLPAKTGKILFSDINFPVHSKNVGV